MLSTAQLSELSSQVMAIAQRAGAEIMTIYARDFAIETKADTSPLTEADLAAHQTIVAGLEAISDLPILSEESANIPWTTRQSWDEYWLVDPLDGTKEFIKKNGEFTVNIALIQRGQPVLGVVYAPVLERTFVGVVGVGATEYNREGQQTITTADRASATTYKVVGSRSHASPETQLFLDALDKPAEIVSMGSSLKLCLVATGEAHFYPRLGPTSEWDTGAAHAVALAAGASVTELSVADIAIGTSAPERLPSLTYNQKDSVLNPYFLVSC